MKINLLCAICTLFLSTLLFSQNPIPNPSFENWTEIDPDDWFTSNSPGGNNTNVTRFSPGHTGEFAAKGEITVWPNTPGFPFIPLLESNTGDFGFPVSERHGNLSMYYQFHKAGPDDVFTIFVGVMDEEGSVFGGGFVDVTVEADTFTLLNIPLSYAADVEPHRAYVSMTINNNIGELPALGSYFIVDDFSMGESVVSSVGDPGSPNASFQNIYPNPTSAELTVSFTLLQNSHIAICIYDLTGRNIANVFSGYMHDGNYSIPTNLQNLPNGLYLCRLTTEQGSLTQKIRVLRN